MPPDELSVEQWPIERLLPYVANARTHPDEQVAQIAGSIAEFGFNVPCLVDERGVLIAGHGRLIAAKRLGLQQVPVIRLGHLTDAQARAFRLADNRIALKAGWDQDILADELRALRDIGSDLSVIGFDVEDLAALLDTRDHGVTDPDDVPGVQDTPVSRLGDLWALGRHRLLCGDSTKAEDVARVLQGGVPHLMVTDPPYGVEYDPNWRVESGVSSTARPGKVNNDDRADWRDAWALYSGDIAYVWHSGIHSRTVAESLEVCGFQIRTQIIWAKPRLVLGRGDYHWQHEPCWYAVRKGAIGHWNGDRKQTTLWTIGTGEHDDATAHGTQKPVECMRRPIENNSKPGDAVYDPFLGSGTTIIAGEMTGRRCYGIELNPAYVDVAVRRWQAFTGASATLGNDGRTFSDIAEERDAETRAA